MAHNIPAPVRAALADPKAAETFVLEVAESYVDFADPDAFEMLQEEYMRRTDPEYMTPASSRSARAVLYIVRVNGHKVGEPLPMHAAHKLADAHLTIRPDATVTVKPEKV